MCCRLCPVGAVHAGETDASLSPLRGSSTCSRCSEFTSRLIGGWLCVSCYNREREYRKGCNAKGKPPSRMRPLARLSLLVIESGRVRRVTRDLVTDVDELMVAALRDSERIPRFGFDGRASARFAQMALFS